MTKPKKHHFVPQMLLEGFTDELGWLHWCRQDGEDRKVRPTRPEAIFHQNHLYSIISKDGEKDASIELGLSKLESDAGPVIQKILTSVRTGQVPDLSLDEKRIWYLFFSMQWRRSPELQKAVASEGDIIAMYDEALAELRKAAPHRRDEIDALDNEAARRRTVRNVRAESVAAFGSEVLPVLEQRGIAAVRITKSSKSFIVGSRPVVKLTNPGQTDLRDPAVEMWLPVASDVAIGVGDGKGGIVYAQVDDDRQIRHINVAIAMQSAIIAGRSPELIASLANRR